MAFIVARSQPNWTLCQGALMLFWRLVVAQHLAKTLRVKSNSSFSQKSPPKRNNLRDNRHVHHVCDNKALSPFRRYTAESPDTCTTSPLTRTWNQDKKHYATIWFCLSSWGRLGSWKPYPGIRSNPQRMKCLASSIQIKHQVIAYLWQTTVEVSKRGLCDTANLTALLLFCTWPQG